jgi:hypothetical protein
MNGFCIKYWMREVCAKWQRGVHAEQEWQILQNDKKTTKRIGIILE